MELQFQKSQCRCLGRAVREVKNTELTQEVRLGDGMPDIGRVLGAWGQAVLRSKEWRAGQVSASGGVMTRILYAPEDGSEIRSLDTWIPFQIQWDIQNADRDGTLRVLPLLRFLDSRTVSARKIMVRAGIAAMAEALYPTEKTICSADQLPADIQLLKRTYPMMLPCEAGEKTFTLDEELTLPGHIPAMQRILYDTVRTEVTEKKVMTNKLLFRGTAIAHLIYQCNEGNVHTWDFELPFSQLTELEGDRSPDAQADIQLVLTNLELEQGETGQLRLKCGMTGQYLIHDRVMVELTEDAYSTRRTVELAREPLLLPALLETRLETVSAGQQFPGIEGEILDAVFLPDFPLPQRTAEGYSLELPGLFQILYRDESGTVQTATARWTGHTEFPADGDCRVDAVLQRIGSAQAAGSEGGVKVIAQAALSMDVTSNREMTMVTGLTTGEEQEPDPSRPSLILCRPEGDGLWNIAKRCNSTMEAIQKANGLQGEPEDDRILLIPVC